MSSPAQPFASARVLVTGAAGFIGRALSGRLVSHGAEVHGVSRRAVAAPGIARGWQGSLADVEFVRRILREIRPTYVFHLAGAVTGSRDLPAVLPTLEGNLTSTVNLLTAVAESGGDKPRVVMAGSLEEPDDPAAPPSSPYAASKLAAYQYARLFQALYGVSVVVPRVLIVYGPGQDEPKKLIPHVVTSLLRGQSPQLSSGTRPVDWVYVDDVAEGLLAAALAPDLNAEERVDLGSGTLVTTRALVEKIAELIPSTGRPLFGALPDRPMEQVRVADVERTARLIGWRPRTSLDDGLRQTVAWLRERARGHANTDARA